MKKLKLLAFGLISLWAVNVSAANISATDSLKACLESSSEVECVLAEDYILTEATSVSGTKVLNLNGKYLEMDDSITISGAGNELTIKGSGEIYSDSVDLFLVKEGGSLNIEDGTLTTEAVNGSVVYVKGGNVNTALATTIIIGESAKLIANKAIAVGQNGNYAYGVNVTIDGTLEGITGNNSYYLGAAPLYVNGNIKKVDTNVPTITINKTAKIIGGQTGDTNQNYIGKAEKISVNDAASPAVYAAGYAKWIINGGEFYGDEALSIKSGEFIISGGNFTAKGAFVDLAKNNGNGSETTGAAVSVTANNGYEGNVALTITDGEFNSKNGYALYEGDTEVGKDAVDNITISGGNFEGKEGAVKSTNESAFICGGTFNTDIAEKDIAKALDEVVEDGVHYVGIKNKVNILKEGEGTATANLTEAIEGQTVKLTITPAEGHKIKDVIITADNKEIEYIDYKFTMPNDEVQVNVLFEKIEVNVEESEDEIVTDTEDNEENEIVADSEDKKEETKVDSTVSEESEEEKNPETNDTVSTALTILGISLIGVISTLYIKKKYN